MARKDMRALFADEQHERLKEFFKFVYRSIEINEVLPMGNGLILIRYDDEEGWPRSLVAKAPEPIDDVELEHEQQMLKEKFNVTGIDPAIRKLMKEEEAIPVPPKTELMLTKKELEKQLLDEMIMKQFEEDHPDCVW